jgi:hypothetical protein
MTFKKLVDGGLHVLCLLGQDATLCAAGKSGKVEVTGLYRQIYEAAGDIKPKNISIDTLSRAFAGNEIDTARRCFATVPAWLTSRGCTAGPMTTRCSSMPSISSSLMARTGGGVRSRSVRPGFQS